MKMVNRFVVMKNLGKDVNQKLLVPPAIAPKMGINIIYSREATVAGHIFMFISMKDSPQKVRRASL